MAAEQRARRDYDLIDGAGSRARKLGLVSASWYRCAIPRPLMKELMRRSDAPAIRDTVLWYGLIALSGLLFFYALGTAWSVPSFLLYATLYAGPADSRWHECSHGTAFRTRWLSDCLYQAASFQVMRRPTVWRWSHARHHTDTLITGRDREIQIQLPLQPLRVIGDFFGLTLAPFELVRALGNACGWISVEEKSFVPESEWKRIVREGQAWMLILAGVTGAALYWQSWVPFLYVGLLPSVAGSWLYNFFGVTQHACLPENVLDHRLNSRTVLMNPVFRFLYWNMNYHIEHHMFPMVPYHALTRLHRAMAHDCPPPYRSTWAVYGEVLPALVRQWCDPAYHVRRPLPSADPKPRSGTH